MALGKASPTPSSSAPARATVTPNPLTLTASSGQTAFAQQTAFAVQTVGAAGQVSATPSPTDGEAQQNASQSTPLALAQLYPTANTPNPAESLSKNPDVRKVEQYKTEKPSFLYPNRPTDGGAAAVGLPGIALAAGFGLGTIAASDKRRKNAGLVMAGAALVGGVAVAGVVGAVEAQTQTSAQPSHAPVIFQDPNQPTCGAASLAMAMGAWGKDAPSQAEILAFMQANNLQHEYGTGVEELAYTARQMGFEGSYYFCNGSFATIADEVSKGHPVQVSIQLEGYAQPTGHFVTITSISDSVVTYNDPLKGAVELPRAEFEKAWQANGGCAVVVLDEPLADTPASRAPLFAGIGAAVALGGLALLGTESRTGTGAGSTNKATGSKDPSQSSKGSSAKAKQPTASAKKQEQDPEDAEPTEAENKAVAAQNQSQTQTTTTSSTSQTSTQSSGYQLDIWEIAYNAKANLHNENWYKQLPGNQWEIAAKITRAVHEAMRNGDPDPVRAGVAAVDPAVAAQREKEAKERAAKEAAAQKNAQEEHEREVRRRQNEANTQAAIQKQKEQQKADQKKAETTRQTLKAQQTHVPTITSLPKLLVTPPPVAPKQTSGCGAQPQPPRDPDTKKLLPETAQTKASWDTYRTEMAKWNACRANKGLATATVITPPPVAPPPVSPDVAELAHRRNVLKGLADSMGVSVDSLIDAEFVGLLAQKDEFPKPIAQMNATELDFLTRYWTHKIARDQISIDPFMLEFGLSLIPIVGDGVGLGKELYNWASGKEVDKLNGALSLVGLLMDGPFDAVGGDFAIAALKGIAALIPTGAVRELLADLLMQAVKNPDLFSDLGNFANQVRQVGGDTVKAVLGTPLMAGIFTNVVKGGKKLDSATAILKLADEFPETAKMLANTGEAFQKTLAEHPAVVEKLLKAGPDAVKLVEKYGDDAVKLIADYGDDALEALESYETVKHIPGANNVLRDLFSGVGKNTTRQGAIGELLYAQHIGVENIAEMGLEINGQKTVDLLLKDGTIVDVKNLDAPNQYMLDKFVKDWREQAKLHLKRYPTATKIEFVIWDYPGATIPNELLEVFKQLNQDYLQQGVEFIIKKVP
ncbi:MAG TPA: C39 family peptidase [Anaerolineales bacterium]|nr:C39 family peptidase [Anaerolineales bacterium]